LTTLQALYDRVPRLDTTNHRITSPPTDRYNCVAWVRQEVDQWWEPGFQWPPDLDVPDEQDLDAYIKLFERWGYKRCDSPCYEPGYLKIALYEREGEFFHVAKQLRDATWSSKIGVLHDLKHCDLAILEGSPSLQLATAAVFMRRVDDGMDFALEEGRLLLP
jgi:hypothetical protein